MGIKWVGSAMAHITKGAASGAFVTHDHEGGRATPKALSNIGARGLLADGHKLIFSQNILDLIKTRVGRGRFDTNPIGFFQHLLCLHFDRYFGEFVKRLLLERWIIGLGRRGTVGG